MVYNLSKTELEWIENNYPKLTYDKENKLVYGTIHFKREDEEHKISDQYEIEINLETKEKSILPQVKETEGRIKKLCEKLGKEISDLHVNPNDNTLCLTIYERENECFKNGFEIKEFFKNLLEPFLFWISHFEKYGYGPWGEYAHGNLAYLELYAEGVINLDYLRKKFSNQELADFKKRKGHLPCLCGSKKKERDCHKWIYKAIYKLKKEL